MEKTLGQAGIDCRRATGPDCRSCGAVNLHRDRRRISFGEKRPIAFGVAMRVNYGYMDWDDDQKEKYDDGEVDLFRVNAYGAIGYWILSAEYRFYSYMNTIHHGYVGNNINDNWQVQAGVHQVPFGLQPFASHNFWSSGAYYVGLEDDYDMGVKG